MEDSTPKHIGLKVTGIVIGILAAIVLVAVIASRAALPTMRYNMAARLAEQGDYETAAQRLKGLDYKDAQEKVDEYAAIVVKAYLDAGEDEKAIEFLRTAYELNTEEQVQHANDILNAARSK